MNIKLIMLINVKMPTSTSVGWHFGILDHVCYLIVSMPDLCRISYFVMHKHYIYYLPVLKL